jgi:hypothetical protein
LQYYSLTNHFHWLYYKSPQSGVDIGYRVAIPCDVHAPVKVKSELDEFFQRINEEYKKLLVKNGYSDTLWAILRK